jgi:anti-anti-sigma factor
MGGVSVAQFRESTRDGGCVLQVEGEFDLAVVDEFLGRVRDCLDRVEAIQLDLQGVSFIDSSGLGALLRVRKEAAEKNRRVSLVNVTAATNRLLQITGLQNAFDIEPTVS